MEKKEMYVAPEVEVLEVAVEKGFQASADDPIDGSVGSGQGDEDFFG